VPVPAFVIPPAPDIIPEMVPAVLSTVICRMAPPRLMAPDNVRMPVPPDDCPSVKSPLTVVAFAIVRAVADDEARVPPPRVSVPVPRAALFPRRSAPEERVVPPE